MKHKSIALQSVHILNTHLRVYKIQVEILVFLQFSRKLLRKLNPRSIYNISKK